MPRLAIAIASLLFAATNGQAPAGWYPDWHVGSEICILNTTTTPPLLFQRDGYTELTKELCCKRYYTGTAYTHCTEGNQGNYTGTGQFYAMWTDGRCGKDCRPDHGNPACTGVLGTGSEWVVKKPTAKECCDTHFKNILNTDYCIAKSVGHKDEYKGSNGYYLDSSANMCVRDCEGPAPCGGIVQNSAVDVYPESGGAAACCAAKLPSLDPAFCANQNNPAHTGTNQWHDGDSTSQYCKKDCDTGAQCARMDAYDKPFATAALCCAEKKGYMNQDFCKSRSDPATYGIAGAANTGLWYVNFQDNLCHKDCVATTTDPACKDLGTAPSLASNPLYASAALCCAGGLNYLGSTCVTASTTSVVTPDTGTSQWYSVTGSANYCVTDCPVTNGGTCRGVIPDINSKPNGVIPYSTAALCCAGQFSWHNSDICKVLSEGAGTGNTNQWYKAPTGSDEFCVKDCPTTGGTSCKGNPTDRGTPTYSTVELCCSAKLSWVDSVTCKNRSTGTTPAVPAATPPPTPPGATPPPTAPGATPPPTAKPVLTGTGKWYADDTDKKCKQDCVVGAGAGCAGIVTQNSWTTYSSTAAACCSADLTWMNSDLCVARSTGAAHTNKYYADQGKGVCHKDCAVNATAPMCGGAPTAFAITMFDTAAECCSTKLNWVNSATCSQDPQLMAGDAKWWVKWVGEQCVQNCPTASGGSCGGLANTWDQTYSTVTECCGRLGWKSLTDCKKV